MQSQVQSANKHLDLHELFKIRERFQHVKSCVKARLFWKVAGNACLPFKHNLFHKQMFQELSLNNEIKSSLFDRPL